MLFILRMILPPLPVREMLFFIKGLSTPELEIDTQNEKEAAFLRQ